MPLEVGSGSTSARVTSTAPTPPMTALSSYRVLSTRFHPDTRLDRGGHDVGSQGVADGRSRRGRGAVWLRRAGRSPGGRPGGALERAAQGGGGPQVAARRGLGRAGPRDRAGGRHDLVVA